MDMKAIKAVFNAGRVKLTEPAPRKGPVDVLVVFPEPDEDPWEKTLSQKKPRPAFARLMKETVKKVEQGKTLPLDFDQL
jgi:hypothetical protein